MKEDNVKVINQLYSILKKTEQNTSCLSLYLTTRCQLNCKYCDMGKKTQDMPLETIKKSIDFLLYRQNRDVTIQFFGGEPLLRWDLVKKGVAYIEKKHKGCRPRIKIGIATNGILLDKEKLEFLKKKQFYVVFSADGLPATQNINRPPFRKDSASYCYNKVEHALDALVACGIDFFVNMVVGPEDVLRLKENINFFIDKGVKKIRIAYMIGVFWNKSIVAEYFRIVENSFWKGKISRPSVAIQHCENEPILVNSTLTVAHDEQIMIGTALPLGKRFPYLRQAINYGYLDDYHGISEVKRNLCDETKRVLGLASANKKKFQLLVNNIYMGIYYDNLFKRLEYDANRLR